MGISLQAFHLHDLLPPAVNAWRCNIDGKDQPQVDGLGGRFDALAPHVGQQALQRQTCARKQPTARSWPLWEGRQPGIPPSLLSSCHRPSATVPSPPWHPWGSFAGMGFC